MFLRNILNKDYRGYVREVKQILRAYKCVAIFTLYSSYFYIADKFYDMIHKYILFSIKAWHARNRSLTHIFFIFIYII